MLTRLTVTVSRACVFLFLGLRVLRGCIRNILLYLFSLQGCVCGAHERSDHRPKLSLLYVLDFTAAYSLIYI